MIRKVIRSRRLVLRPLEISDYLQWFDAYVNGLPAQSHWDKEPKRSSDCSKSYFKKLIVRHQKLATQDDYYWFGVFEKKNNNLVGAIDFDIFVRSSHQFANFGYFIFNRHWGNGYGQEAATVGLKIGFKQLKLNRLEAAINLDNKKSIRLVKAIGMRKEGIKKRYWFEYGKWVDHFVYVANPEDIGLKPIKP